MRVRVSDNANRKGGDAEIPEAALQWQQEYYEDHGCAVVVHDINRKKRNESQAAIPRSAVRGTRRLAVHRAGEAETSLENMDD